MNANTHRLGFGNHNAAASYARSGDGTRSPGRIGFLASFLIVLLVALRGPGIQAETEPPPHSLEAALRAANRGNNLPLGFGYQVARRLRLRFHDREDFNRAHYAPFPLRPLEGIADETALPKGPTLYLYSPAFSHGGGLRPLQDLPLDSAEGLFNALLNAYFELEILPSPSPLRQKIFEHAKLRLPHLAAKHRAPALVQGLADFGSHVLSIANRLNLLETQSLTSGKDLCPLLKHPGNLFGLWEGIFSDGRYLARFYRSAAVGKFSGRWIETATPISREDKEILIQDVFRTSWKGSRQEDLVPRFCSPKKAEAAP